MAHTDKDTPYWVLRATSIHIEHDHRDGRCVIEELNDTRDAKRHWPAVWSYKIQNRKYGGPPEAITCTRELADEAWGHPWTRGGCPNWYVRHEFHKPERARQRTKLTDARKWAREDLEDFDLPERKAKNSCKYEWW